MKRMIICSLLLGLCLGILIMFVFLIKWYFIATAALVVILYFGTMIWAGYDSTKKSINKRIDGK